MPAALGRLQEQPTDRAALRVVRRAEASVLAEAGEGRLAASEALLEVYSGLVASLEDGAGRVSELRRRVGERLLAVGDGRHEEGDLVEARRAWALAARLDPEGDALQRLRAQLLPPPGEQEPGTSWTSPLDGAELAWVPPAQFRLGCTVGDRDCWADETSPGWVSLDGFWMERTEVTHRRYRRCVLDGACSPPVQLPKALEPTEPVTGVTWRQAKELVAWLNRSLPSEVQWERAARGTDFGERFPWGASKARPGGNVWQTGPTDPFPELAPVGSFPATPLGLYDLGGNAWEWCEDRYRRSLEEVPRDGSAWRGEGWGRVLRGGSWRRGVELARVSARTWHDEGYAADDVGFRSVMAPAEEIDDRAVIELAGRHYPVPSPPGGELATADLDTADRRYLERRTVTWLMVEGRLAEALPRAARLLERDPSDPVARDLLDQVGEEVVTAAERGRIEEASELFAAVEGTLGPRHRDRVEQLEGRLVRSLQLSVQVMVRARNLEAAAEGLRLALELSPRDSALRRLVERVAQRPGAVRVWPGDGREMVWIPGGRYEMGASLGDGDAFNDEHPRHPVTVDGFWLDRREVTNADYRRCVDAGACTVPHRTQVFDDPNLQDHPVMWVDWFQARSYARWAGKRLPTEAEWEWAARGGSEDAYPWGPDWRPSLANALGTEEDDRWGGSAPVGSFPSTSPGLFDIVGNAAEWVEDLYHSDYMGAPSHRGPWNQLTGPFSPRRRVIRGGSYADPPQRQRVSYRHELRPDDHYRAIGFRCAASPASRLR